MERIKLYGTQWSTHEDIWPNVKKITLPKYTSRKPKKKKFIIVNCIDICMYYMTFKYQLRFTISIYVLLCVYSYFRSYDNQNSGTFIMYRNIDSDGNVMEVIWK